MYKLIWEENFMSDTIDPSKWEIVHAGTGFGNAENQFYTPREKNIRIENDCLIIEAHKEVYEHLSYTSAKITTRNLFSMQYGRVVVRAKLPKGKGTWPAIWMMPNSFHEGEKWPRCGEIDMMEHVGRDEDMIHFSLHTGKYNHNNKTQYTYFERLTEITERFAEYEMIWNEEYIEFLVDGHSYAKFTKGENGHDTTFDGWPFDQKFYLIINLAIGGFWGGEIDETVFPLQFLIDYVKVYKAVKE